MSKISQTKTTAKGAVTTGTGKAGAVISKTKKSPSKYSKRYNAVMNILSDIDKSEIASIEAVTKRILKRSR